MEWPWRAAAALVAVVLMGSGCGRQSPVIQLSAPVNHVVETFWNIDAQTHVSIGSMLVCLSEPGAATVVSVEPDRPVGDVQVSDFRLRPNPLLSPGAGSMLGSAKGTLQAAGFVGGHQLDAECGSADSGAGYELGVDLTNPSGAGAGAHGWKITYEVSGTRQTFVFPLVTVVCPDATSDAPKCKELTLKADSRHS